MGKRKMRGRRARQKVAKCVVRFHVELITSVQEGVGEEEEIRKEEGGEERERRRGMRKWSAVRGRRT